MLTNIILFLCVLNALRLLYKNRATLKRLSVRQWIRLLLLYAGAICLLFVAVYYGVNWITRIFEQKYVRIGVFVVALIVLTSIVERPFKRMRDQILKSA